MQSVRQFSTTFLLLLMIMMLVMISSFLLFEQQSNFFVSSVAEQLKSTDGIWLLALFLIIILSCDIVLPIPSSVVAVFAATTLGFWGGAMVIWFGLMVSCCLGYFLGVGSTRFLKQQIVNQDDLNKAKGLVSKLGAGTLVTCRGVPIFAEISVIAAGMIRYPLWSFLIICALTNTGLAAAYAYVGSQVNINNSFWLVIFGSIAVPAAAWIVKFLWQKIDPKCSDDSIQSTVAQPITCIEANFKLSHHYPVLFENQVFDHANPELIDLFQQRSSQQQSVFVYADSGVDDCNPQLCQKINIYFQHYKANFTLLAPLHRKLKL